MTPPDIDALDERLAAALANLTPAQRGRALAFLSGETKTAIAVREGVSPQAVDQTLRTPAVQAFCSIAGHRYAVNLVKIDGGEAKPIAQALFQGLVEIALGATRPVVHGGNYALVPDYSLRLEATRTVLDFIEPPGGIVDRPADHKDQRSAQRSGGGETIAREKTTVSRTREIRSRP